MKKKSTKGAKKSKVRDLAARRRAGAAVKGGATSSVTAVKDSLQGPTCWLERPGDAILRG
jgi:hypothetical protein